VSDWSCSSLIFSNTSSIMGPQLRACVCARVCAQGAGWGVDARGGVHAGGGGGGGGCSACGSEHAPGPSAGVHATRTWAIGALHDAAMGSWHNTRLPACLPACLPAKPHTSRIQADPTWPGTQAGTARLHARRHALAAPVPATKHPCARCEQPGSACYRQLLTAHMHTGSTLCTHQQQAPAAASSRCAPDARAKTPALRTC
jgi:hypothetical protein